MKKTFVLLIIVLCTTAQAQEKWSTKSGEIAFEASVPSFEEVKATNKQVGAIVKSDGTVACLALMNGFRFKVALMEEHFNENYVESERFPKAVLKGKIKDFNIEVLSETPVEFILTADLSLHGETKVIDVPVFLVREADGIGLTTEFQLKPEDFNIEIPSVVANKVAKSVDVSVSLKLKGNE